ncbi:hypothetical protein ACFX2A_023131 [Malus domestica]
MCGVCQQAPAAVTCKADTAAICVGCDTDIHSVNLSPAATSGSRSSLFTTSPRLSSSSQQLARHPPPRLSTTSSQTETLYLTLKTLKTTPLRAG